MVSRKKVKYIGRKLRKAFVKKTPKNLISFLEKCKGHNFIVKYDVDNNDKIDRIFIAHTKDILLAAMYARHLC